MCNKRTSDVPVLWRISETVTQGVVQKNLGRVGPRLKCKKHDLVCAIILVYHHRRKGGWSLFDVHSPGITSSPLQDSFPGHGLDIETTEFTYDDR